MKNMKDKFSYIMEMLILAIVVFSTRSVYAHVTFDFHFNILLIISMAIYIGFRIFKKDIQIKDKNKSMIAVAIYYIYLLVFLIFNKISDLSNFISCFCIILPGFVLLLNGSNNKTRGKELLIKYSNIILILAVISLIMYFLGPLTGIINPHKIKFFWGDERLINSYWNIHFQVQNSNIMNFNIIRNTGVFAEAPMYCLHLTLAIVIQLFMTNRINYKKIIILFVTILSSFSAIGIIGATLFIVSKIVLVKLQNNIKNENVKSEKIKKISTIILCIVLIIISIFIFNERKNKSESLFIRVDDYKAGFSVWKEYPIFGNGYLESQEIEKYMDENRMHNKGLSNSLMTLLAQGGIYFFALYFIPFVLTSICFLKQKKYNYLLINFALMFLFITSIFQYSTLMMFLLAIQYSYLIKYRYLISKKEKNTCIYVIAHKNFKSKNLDNYVPIQVGASINNTELGFVKDNTGENISLKNKNYCELTGLYWIWKNDNSSKNVGIVHYRRYFVKDFMSNRDFLETDEIEEILKNNDIILPKKEIYGGTAIQQYSRNSGFKEDWDKIKKIIETRYPSYLNSYEKIMNGNKMYQFNMFICSKECYDAYCTWLFDILFELENEIDLNERNDYQKRIYGFISERLLNVWVDHNQLKIREFCVVNTEEKLRSKIRGRLRRIKNNYRFKRGI